MLSIFVCCCCLSKQKQEQKAEMFLECVYSNKIMEMYNFSDSGRFLGVVSYELTL